MALESWFSIPAYTYDVKGDELDVVQAEIANKITEIEQRTDSNVWDDNINTTFKYDPDRHNVNDLDIYELTETKAMILKHVNKYCSFFNDFKVDLHSSWFNFSKQGNFQFAHDHVSDPHADHSAEISGVYYYQTNGEDGDICFINPFNAARYFHFGRVSSRANNIYTPTEGRLLLFPSFVEHKVRPNKTDSTRISLAFNFTRK